MNYFKQLTKEEKKKIKVAFLNDKEASLIYYKANRIFNICVFGIVLAIGAGLFDILYKTGTINYVLDGLLFVFSILFLYKTSSMKNHEINKFALEKKDVIKR